VVIVDVVKIFAVCIGLIIIGGLIMLAPHFSRDFLNPFLERNDPAPTDTWFVKENPFAPIGILISIIGAGGIMVLIYIYGGGKYV
jgi:hypothetical protein